MDDVARLRQALKPVEKDARGLPWAKERPWKTETHVGLDAGVPTVDLHDLGRKTASQAVDAAVALGPELEAGAFFLVVGRGRRSVGGPVLPGVVDEKLRAAAQEHGWQIRRPRAGRFGVIVDRSKAPPAATGALGWAFWLWMLIVALAAFAALFNAMGSGL